MNIVFLFDIEGTISDLSFVKEILFPYSKKRLHEFIHFNQNDKAVEVILREVKQTLQEEHTAETDLPQQIAALESWIELDRKHPALKKLQALIWSEGFRSGELVSEVYPDFVPALKVWKNRGLRFGIYSSGSESAQKLFLEFTQEGDLRPFFDYFFDLESAGPKQELTSYSKILNRLKHLSDQVCFFSDMSEEVVAARQAGMLAFQVVRDNRTIPNTQGIPILKNFLEPEELLHTPLLSPSSRLPG